MNDLERAQHILVVGALAAVARVLFSDGPLSPRALAANIAMAAAIGWLGVLVAEWQSWTAGQVGIFVGILAWLGPTYVTEVCRRALKAAARAYIKDEEKP